MDICANELMAQLMRFRVPRRSRYREFLIVRLRLISLRSLLLLLLGGRSCQERPEGPSLVAPLAPQLSGAASLNVVLRYFRTRSC